MSQSAEEKTAEEIPAKSPRKKITIPKSMFSNSSPFVAALNEVFNQSWGGKVDRQADEVLAVVVREHEKYEKRRTKLVRQHGIPDSTTGGFGLKGASAEAMRAFYSEIDALDEETVELPIYARLRLVKTKKYKLPPVNAAILQDVIAVDWPESDEANE